MTDWREEIWPGCTQDATLPKMPPKSGYAVQWIGSDGGCKVGTIAVDVNGQWITRADDRLALVKHSHTGDLEWVGYDDLQPYQLSPISEPTK